MAEVQLNKTKPIDLQGTEGKGAPVTGVTQEEATFKSALTSGAKFPNTSPQEFVDVRDSLKNTGSSPTVQQVLQSGEDRKIEQGIQDLEAFATDTTIPEADRLKLVDNVLQQHVDTSLNEEFERNASLQAATPNTNASNIQRSIADYLFFRTELPEVVRRIEVQEGVTYNPDTAVRDVISNIALPGYGINLYEVLHEAAPEFTRPEDVTFPGSMVTRFKEYFVRKTPTEQEQIIRNIVRAVEKNKFYGMDNGALKRDLMVTLLGDFKPSKAEEILINAMTVMDYLALGELLRVGNAAVRGSLKLAKKGEFAQRILNNYMLRKKPWSISTRMDTVSTEESRAAVRSVLEDNADPLPLGETRESLTNEHILPKPADESGTTASPDINDPEDVVLGFDGRAIAFDDLEQLGLENRATERARAILSVAPAVHLNKTQVRAIEGGIEARTFIGLPDRGFDSIKKAEVVQSELRDQFPTEIWVHDGRTNQFKPIAEVPEADRIHEYLLSFTEELKYSSVDTVARNPILKGGLTGRLAKFFTKSSYLDKITSLSGSSAGDIKAARNKLLSEKLAPLFNLNTEQRAKVEDLIDRGDQIGKFFSEGELELEFGHRGDFEKLKSGYEAFQDFQQTQWKMVNDGIRERLDALGMKEIKFPKRPYGDQKYIGKPVQLLPNDIRRIYDPVTGEIVDVDELERLADKIVAKEGGTDLPYIELRKPIRIKGEETYWVKNKGDKGSLRVFALPPEVIKNVPGRIPRLYEVTHIVKRRERVWRNGQEVEIRIPVKMAQNDGDAWRLADELEKADPKYDPEKFTESGRRYVVEKANELKPDMEYAQRTSLDYFEDSGQLWVSERGFELDGVDGKRPLLPVQERLSAAREHAARINTIDLLTEKWIKNWEKEFGREFGTADQSGVMRMPIYGDLQQNATITKTEKGSLERRYRDAQAFRDHILLVMGVDPGQLQRTINGTAVYVADKLATPKALTAVDRARNRSASFILKHRNFSPINWAKQLAFMKFIVGNPIRQLALQASQASIYVTEEHALRYLGSGKGFRDWQGLVTGLLTRDNPAMFEQLAKKQASLMGMSVEEYVDFVDAFRKTGLLQNIDSHAFAANMLSDKKFGGSTGFIQAKGYDALNGAIQAARYIRKLGFDAGEASQLMVAFLVKRNQWIKNHPKQSSLWSKGKNLAEIGAGARQISFEMTREGAMAHQKGLLGLISQFSSHNTKAWQALLPEKLPVLGKLSNKAFSDKQRAAIALSQLSIYGTGGFGVYEGYERAKALWGEPPEELDLLIKEGLFGGLINAILRGVTGEPIDLDIAGNAAPFSGLPSLPVFRVMGDAAALGLFDVGNIPAGSLKDDVVSAIDTISFLTGKIDDQYDNIDTVDKAFLAIDEIARLVPLYNQVMTAKAELAINRIITASGNETVQIYGAEIISKALFNIKPASNRQLYAIQKQIRGRQLGGDQYSPIDADLTEYARNIYKQMKIVLSRTGDPKERVREARDLAQSVARVDRLSMTEFEYRRVHQQLIPQIMYNDLRKGTVDAELIRQLESLVGGGRIETTNSIIDRVEQSEVLRENKRYANWLRDLGD